MERRDPLLELSILYDTARGLLRLRDRDEILSTVLLSLMGACGASRALWLERGDDDVLRVDAAEGFDALDVVLKWTRKMEAALGPPRAPLGPDGLATLGAAFARAAETLGLQIVAPVGSDERVAAIVALGPKLPREPWTERDFRLVQGIAEQAALSLESIAASGARTRRRGDPERQIRALRERHPSLDPIRGDGPFTLELLERIVALADFDLPVLILGETGTGKELVAKAIHDLSRRRLEHFEAINCAAIPRDLMASALFGHEKGAFTGADSTVVGAFERATNGTIFLDEIGDMPLDTQAVLLRVLQERGFRRVGGTDLLPTNARVISATNRDLVKLVEQDGFRRDLYYRLRMYTVRLAPLRERRDEIPALAKHVLSRFAPEGGRTPVMTREFVEALATRELPGNVRELESLIAGAFVHAAGATELRLDHLPEEPEVASSLPLAAAVVSAGEEPDVPTFARVERDYIRRILELTEGNKREAARLMGIPRTTLIAKIRRFGMETGSPR
jgi:formate hydrogenlyase transcriptional activator